MSNSSQSQARAQAQSIADLYAIYQAFNDNDADDLPDGCEIETDEDGDLISVEYDHCDYSSTEDVIDTVKDNALSVEVRSTWTTNTESFEAEEFRIVLCTGGPHVEIRGNIGLHGQPEDPEVYSSDWFEGLQRFPLADYDALEWFCGLFYFGE